VAHRGKPGLEKLRKILILFFGGGKDVVYADTPENLQTNVEICTALTRKQVPKTLVPPFNACWIGRQAMHA
jgi:hypothetical protein